jgi:hypothetical protein
MLDVAVPYTGEHLDVPHFRRSDEHFAVLADEDCLAVAADVILLDADGLLLADSDLANDLRVAHQVAVLLAVVSHGHQLAAAWSCADMLDNKPHEARHL